MVCNSYHPHRPDGDRLVLLLAGGTKKRQDADIAGAKVYWQDYKRRKRQEV
jgi:putative component of toxin-antitoxin plasmid stabilization module